MEFSSAYRKILLEDASDAMKQSFQNMKSLPLIHNEAMKTLDQDCIHLLLKSKLRACNTISEHLQGEEVINLKIDIKSLEILNLMKESCMEREICCNPTKQSLQRDFQEFRKCFQRKSNHKDATLPTFERKTMYTKSNRVVDYGDSNKAVPGFVRASLLAENLSSTMNNNASGSGLCTTNNNGQKRKLGTRSRTTNKKFVSPLLSSNECDDVNKSEELPITYSDENLKNIDPKMVELIRSEIMDTGTPIDWDDIAGLKFAKSAIQEAVIWPMLRPDIFTGLRRPPKGILLFGPPGTGKTLIGKCVASQSKSTFFSISASSLTSKWIGDGEKMVRVLFAVARSCQPAVIFIDEIDSLLSQRSDTEHESSRRIKTEFLVQLDGATTDNEERLLLVGATNRPQEVDEAARRRFVKRLYIPLPDYEARLQLLKKLISGETHVMTEQNFEEVARLSEGYSGADIRSLCSEASLGPIRSINMRNIANILPEEVRPLMMEDFQKAFLRVKSSVSPKDLEQYVQWDNVFGSGF